MSSGGTADFESLLRQALGPVEPPADLAERLQRRLEDRLDRLNQLAVDELEQWELESLTDPRNWTRIARPIAAGVVATGAGTALVILRLRKESKRSALQRMLRR